ncbi:nesprin-2 [Acanthochromis polyacanthus]|uniref:nesprin-2 n=1 Tax=Acanthochromis polyacanthus TaxID=80966 RepID=UPI00223443F2|nr:nesprin-2 [Acanthochromis polyacanthus]
MEGKSVDGDLEGHGGQVFFKSKNIYLDLFCIRLDRKWLLWHDFMKEHAHLDAWLRLAEQAVASPSPAHFTYTTAKEELRRFERLRSEAGSRLVQLDSLTRSNRTLTRMFDGVMRTRLLSSAGECGRRWDDVNQKLESITAGLKLLVSEWEEFEAQGAELTLWLADMDVRLTEVDHLTGSSCEKLRQLQLQQCVCVNSARVGALLSRGEDLIQRSSASGQQVELRLLELLRRCSNVYNNIARTHTRLLSMRLVFEDDWILSQATDSGCPSENPPEEEEVVDKHLLDLPATSTHPKDPPSSPTHEHLGLEWDPSVDVGRSVSRDDADSSYFSACTGRCRGDGLKRRSYLSCSDSRSDISNDVTNQEVELGWESWPDHSRSFSPVATGKDQWTTSTPDRQSSEPICFDGGRVKAWLRVQSSAPSGRPSCSKAVQTKEEKVECFLDGSYLDNQLNPQRCHDNTQVLFPDPAPFLSHDPRVKASSDWSVVQAEEEPSCWEETEQRRPRSSWFHPALLSVLLVLLASLIWILLNPPCHRSNRMQRSFHLMLRYVNGPPPT